MLKMVKYNKLAEEILDLAKVKIMSQFRFFAGTVTILEMKECENDIFFATDGRVLLFNPKNIVSIYKAEKNQIVSGFLHVLMHCMIGHIFYSDNEIISTSKERYVWNIACDMAAEWCRLELSQDYFPLNKDAERRSQLERITDYAKGNTAEKIYTYLITFSTPEELEMLRTLFMVDNHDMWFVSKIYSVENGNFVLSMDKSNENNPEKEEDGRKIKSDYLKEDISKENEKQKDLWKKNVKKINTDIEFFQNRQGLMAGHFLDHIKQMLFEEVDYTDFLRIFGNENEILKPSQEEFDVIYYTYGLEKYGDIALIEPLEYCNDKRIKEFVIAIDTSGSVQGEIVQDFLKRTFQVLRQTGSFTRKVEIYIVQCDSEISQCTKITELKELDSYINDMRLSGFGGTDFRPVFQYIDDLQKKHKLQKLDGLIYFTDGVGTYPSQRPPYKTAFIFNRDDYISPNVPNWAVKAVLTSNSIKIKKEKV